MVKISETLSLVHQTMRCHEWESCIFGVKDAKQTICKQLWWKIALMHYVNERGDNQSTQRLSSGMLLGSKNCELQLKIVGGGGKQQRWALPV